MRGKFVGTLFALVFAVPFGGVGLFCGWTMFGMVRDSARAADWVVVQARVESADLKVRRGKSTTYQASGSYRYQFGGREHTSTQIGLASVGGADNIGDWHESMGDFLREALEKRQTISVYVNPDNPAEAVVDRDVRWGFFAFLSVFAILFGGVGVGALAAVVAIWVSKEGGKGKDGRKAARRAPAASGSGKPIAAETTGIGILWGFVLLWNGIAFPACLVVIPKIIAKGDWAGVMILLFPLAGLGMLWFAIAKTLELRRLGKPTLVLNPAEPVAGESFEGVVTFPRGVGPGEAFKVVLVRKTTTRTRTHHSKTDESTRETDARTVAGPQGARLAFRLGIPETASPHSGDDGTEVSHAWSIDVKPAKGAYCGFTIAVHVPEGRGAAMQEQAGGPPARRFEAEVEKLFGAVRR